ncbi:hypothetical protein KT99_08613 [Shewanella benthica KT99]|uniref:Uncharacterized protein n=1 Tax=Shewanella benthica KT99 TaxID=314608 RepID=A9D175_9GAMM|nr:hypothetical protein KT99_08613 [Shewanella benthica KT99]
MGSSLPFWLLACDDWLLKSLASFGTGLLPCWWLAQVEASELTVAISSDSSLSTFSFSQIKGSELIRNFE